MIRIVVQGPSRCGKSFLIRRLTEFLTKNGYIVQTHNVSEAMDPEDWVGIGTIRIMEVEGS